SRARALSHASPTYRRKCRQTAPCPSLLGTSGAERSSPSRCCRRGFPATTAGALIYPGRSDHRLERPERPHPHHVPGWLGLEDHGFLREGVDPLPLLGGRLPLDRDAHQAGYLEDARATPGEVGLDQGTHDVKHGGHIATMNADMLGDGA